jgi:hypothetical protein
MNPRHRTGNLARAAAAAAALTLALPGASAGADGWSMSVGPVGGVLALDAALTDYRWDTSVRPVWGLGGSVSDGRFGAGVRVWRSRTTQSTGIPGETFAPDVDLTGTDVFGAIRIADAAGIRLLASASLGALHLGWSPDSAILAPFGAGETIEISYEPVTEPITGMGISAQRTLFGGLDLVLGLERSWFRLDTVHRAGDEIVAGRDTFGNWTVRAELSHRVLQL